MSIFSFSLSLLAFLSSFVFSAENNGRQANLSAAADVAKDHNNPHMAAVRA